MKLHYGQILEKAIRQSEYPISKLAKRIGYTRQHMYNLFNQPKIDLGLLDEIGKVLKYDFSDDIKSLSKYHDDSELNISPKINTKIPDTNYIRLLEDYNKLLVEHQKLLKQKIKEFLMDKK